MYRKLYRNGLVLTVLLGFLLASCSTTKQEMRADDWVFGENQIKLHIKTSQDLNFFDNNPHNLLLAVFQMSDPNMFNSLKSSTEGLQKLLVMDDFDASLAILNVKKIELAPGSSKTELLDRAKSAKYVGIIAGYFYLNPDRVAEIVSIEPIYPKKKGFAAANPLSDPPPPIPGHLEIWLELEKEGIHHVNKYIGESFKPRSEL